MEGCLEGKKRERRKEGREGRREGMVRRGKKVFGEEEWGRKGKVETEVE